VPPILLLSEKDLGKISAPILLLAGEQEHIFDPAKMITRAKKYIKNIKCILVNSAGHTMTIDQNHLVGQYILEFLQQM
jgi:pimeloyl-ACP methyl ester carboxylesterase